MGKSSTLTIDSKKISSPLLNVLSNFLKMALYIKKVGA